MSEPRAEILTGAAVLAVALGFLVWASKGEDFGSTGGQYPLRASFRSVEGVTVGTDVRMAGVKIGTVTGLSLNPQTFFADATVSLRDDVILPEDFGHRDCLRRAAWRRFRRDRSRRKP